MNFGHIECLLLCVCGFCWPVDRKLVSSIERQLLLVCWERLSVFFIWFEPTPDSSRFLDWVLINWHLLCLNRWPICDSRFDWWQNNDLKLFKMIENLFHSLCCFFLCFHRMWFVTWVVGHHSHFNSIWRSQSTNAHDKYCSFWFMKYN